jgi:hypothetical protein
MLPMHLPATPATTQAAAKPHKAPKPPKATRGSDRAIVTANHLAGGAVVFRTPEGQWVGDPAAAEVAESPEAATDLLARAQADHDACIVVEPVLIAVEVTPSGPQPLALRERIRATGPTIALPGARSAALPATR